MTNVDIGSNVFVEHANSVDTLWHTLSERIPLLLRRTSRPFSIEAH